MFTHEQSQAILEGREMPVAGNPGDPNPNPNPGDPNPNPNPGDPNPNPNPGDPNPNPNPGNPNPNPNPGDPNPNPAPTINYEQLTKGRFKTQEEFEAHLSGIDEFQSTRQRLTKALEIAEDPIPFEGIRNRVSFMRATGITDENVATRIVSATNEDFQKDPILALAIQDVINKPSLLNGILTFDQILEGYREMYDFTGTDSEGLPQYGKKALLALEAAKAVDKIEETRKTQADQPDIFAQRIADNKKRLESVQKAKEEWQGPDVQKAIKDFTFKMKFGDMSLEVPGGQKTQELTNTVVEMMVNAGVDPSTPEGMEKFQSTRNQLFALQNLEHIVAFAVKEAVENTSSEIKKNANTVYHNLQPIVRSAGQPANPTSATADDVAKTLLGYS